MKLHSKQSPSPPPVQPDSHRLQRGEHPQYLSKNEKFNSQNISYLQNISRHEGNLYTTTANLWKLNKLEQDLFLNLKLLEITQIGLLEEQHQIDWGFIVGIFNPAKINQELPHHQYQIVRIGPLQEISSLTALRQYCLDSLIVYYKEGSLYPPQDILKIKQKVVLVIEHRSDVARVILAIEHTLLDIHGQQTVQKFADKLLLRVIKYKGRYVLKFLEEQDFYEAFVVQMRRKFLFLRVMERVEGLGKLMTIREYYQCRLNKSDNIEFDLKIKRFKASLEQDIILQLMLSNIQLSRRSNDRLLIFEPDTKINEPNQIFINSTKLLQGKDGTSTNFRGTPFLKQTKLQEQINRIKIGLDAQSSQQPQPSVQILQNRNANDADEEVQYFRARQSQVETKESWNRRPQIQDLYYFIEEHDSSSQDEKKKFAARYSNSESVKPLQLLRRKSQGSLNDVAPQELDDQFFTKY